MVEEDCGACVCHSMYRQMVTRRGCLREILCEEVDRSTKDAVGSGKFIIIICTLCLDRKPKLCRDGHYRLWFLQSQSDTV